MLVDHYHLTMGAIARLTDRTINDIYFHARTKEGSIEIPTIPVEAAPVKEETEESLIADLNLVKAMLGLSDDNYADCVEQIKRKFRGSAN